MRSSTRRRISRHISLASGTKAEPSGSGSTAAAAVSCGAPSAWAFGVTGPVQNELRHGVAERVIAPLGQALVEMLDREVGGLVPVEPEHPLELLLRRPPRRRAAPGGRRAPPRRANAPAAAGTSERSSPKAPPPSPASSRLRPSGPRSSKTASCGFPRECAPFTSSEITSLHVLATRLRCRGWRDDGIPASLAARSAPGPVRSSIPRRRVRCAIAA